MKITKFDIKNFKGITHTSVHLSDETPGNIVTLIGLNESGKTTILEAISHFLTEDKDTANLVGTVQPKSALQDLIPKDRKAAFTGRTSIIATIILEDTDIDRLAEFFLKEKDLILERESVTRKINVERAYEYDDSTHKFTHAFWNINFSLKAKRARKSVLYTGIPSSPESLKAIWVSGVSCLQKFIPKIVYFPTFLFDFPDRIYLEGDDKEINSYYAQVIQDVLDSLEDEKLNVQKHIVDRIQRLRVEHSSIPTFMAYLFGRDEKKQIDAVLQKISNKMSEVIFGSWNQILGRNVTGKRVQIDWLLDGEKSNSTYLELSIIDGQSKYSLSERSLGFRWFFSFLLFTQFRRNRKTDGATVFLFDEPAANLHSKAQIKLLESFSKIARDATYIIYSTHSHYMVNPLWLEKAYIVENKATDYEKEEDVDSFKIKKTDIGAIRYRTFVGSYPSKITYFQPVLDALDVAFSPLIKSSRALIVEGKNDYFPIVYLRKILSHDDHPEVFPANGAGDIATIVSLFRGWNVAFRVLFDDDAAGKRGKKKAKDELFLRDHEAVTIGDISEILQDKSFESIYQIDVISAVKSMFNIESPTKRHFSLYFQQLIVSGKIVSHPDTEALFAPISSWIDEAFSEPNSLG